MPGRARAERRCATCTPPATCWSCRRSPTRTFREPWGLVVNEAMNRGLAVIATDAVGAAAGGLVRDGSNGLVVPAGDSAALARRDRAAGRRRRRCAARLGARRGAGRARVQPRGLGAGLLARAGQRRRLPRALVAFERSAYENRPSREPTDRSAQAGHVHAARSAAGGGVCSRSPQPARADVGETIIQRCTHGKSLSGFSQSAYSQALKELSADTEEYSDCSSLIRQAQLAAAGGRGGGAGGGQGGAHTVALAATPAEQRAIAHAAARGLRPVKLGGGVDPSRASCTSTSPPRSARCPPPCSRPWPSCSPACCCSWAAPCATVSVPAAPTELAPRTPGRRAGAGACARAQRAAADARRPSARRWPQALWWPTLADRRDLLLHHRSTPRAA